MLRAVPSAESSLRDIFRRFGTAGPSAGNGDEILKGPLKDGFPDHRNLSRQHIITMSDKGGNAAHNEGGGGAAGATTKRGRAKRHCMRWWWVHLLIFIAIVVLVVCLIIFVAVPKIAQQRVDGAKLSIQSIVVTQTQSDNYTMSINSTIHADDSIHAVIDGFEGVLYLEDWEPQTPFASLAFPQTTSAETTAVNLTQFTPVTDLNAFTVFNTWLLVNETLNLTVSGKTHVRVSGISKKYPVDFKHTINMPGLGNFNGTTTSNTSISITPDADGNNFFGTVTIPNRSFLTFEIV